VVYISLFSPNVLSDFVVPPFPAMAVSYIATCCGCYQSHHQGYAKCLQKEYMHACKTILCPPMNEIAILVFSCCECRNQNRSNKIIYHVMLY